MTDDPARIAAKLTEAQREALMRWGSHGYFTVATIRSLGAKGLTDIGRLTPLGLAVRQHIGGNNGDR